jgi:four helix bundle protein
MNQTESSKGKAQNYSAKGKTELKYRAYKFSLRVISFIYSFPEKRIYWIISNQLLRAATSVGANIVEAQSASSRRDFIKFYEIALKSANETKYWLCLIRDSELSGMVDKSLISELLEEANIISKILGASLLTLKGKRSL